MGGIITRSSGPWFPGGGKDLPVFENGLAVPYCPTGTQLKMTFKVKMEDFSIETFDPLQDCIMSQGMIFWEAAEDQNVWGFNGKLEDLAATYLKCKYFNFSCPDGTDLGFVENCTGGELLVRYALSRSVSYSDYGFDIGLSLSHTRFPSKWVWDSDTSEWVVDGDPCKGDHWNHAVFFYLNIYISAYYDGCSLNVTRNSSGTISINAINYGPFYDCWEYLTDLTADNSNYYNQDITNLCDLGNVVIPNATLFGGTLDLGKISIYPELVPVTS